MRIRFLSSMLVIPIIFGLMTGCTSKEEREKQQKKAEMENLSIPDEVLLFIANSIRSNIREIEGSLVRLLAFSSLTGQDITIDMARDVLKDFLSRRGRNATVPSIQKTVAKEFHVPESAMVSKRRTAEIALARQVAMYLARELAGLSLKQIGTRSREQIERLLGTKVYLKLFVRIQKNWRKDTRAIRKFGY